MNTAESNVRPKFPIAACVLAIWLLAIVIPKLLWANPAFKAAMAPRGLDVMLLFSPTVWVLASVVGWLTVRALMPKQEHAGLGLGVGWRRAIAGFAFGCACTAPMGLLAIWCDNTLAPRYIGYSTLLPGLTEELLFRGFAFGLLVRAARWKLWPAAVLTGVVFGLVHIDFTPDDGETILGQAFTFWIFLIALAGVLYAWLYARSGWNLWIVIALHTSMNFWWDAFDLASSPMGGLGATVVRIASVGIAITAVEYARGTLIRPGAPARTIDL